MEDYYKTLGVLQNATEKEIKQAYRKKIRTLHPDLQGSDITQEQKKQNAEQAVKINNAFEVLSDVEKRSLFDQGIDPLGKGHSNSGYSNSYANPFEQFASMFGEDLFGFAQGGGFGGSRGKRSFKQPGRDLLKTVKIDLSQVIFGAKIQIEYSRYLLCSKCNGSCTDNGKEPQDCSVCHGTGSVTTQQRTLLGIMQTTSPCNNCNGTGKFISNPCSNCNGYGIEKAHEKFEIVIPKGVQNGMKIRFEGKGSAGEYGGNYGDLFVEVSVKAHDFFVVDEHDLHCQIEVPFQFACLGYKTQIETIDGKKDLEIPAGTQVDSIIRMNKLGIPLLNNESIRGNILVHVKIEIPKKLDKKQQELLLQYQESDKNSRVKLNKAQKESFFEKLFKMH